MDIENQAPSNRSNVEQIYQKKTQLEHIILRPDTYVGSVEQETTKTWVYDDVEKKMEYREITFVPGMYKIFDEILVNAADNKQRDARMDTLRVDIDSESGQISVYNNGRGIPVQMHKEHGVYVPELIFGHLLTSSNYDDDQKKTTGGRNGFGAKLTNIYSTEFIVETSDGRNKFKQVFSDNMKKRTKPRISQSKKEWTRVTFTPDYEKFGMFRGLTPDVVSLLKKRVYDMAGCLGKGVKCYLNGDQIKIKSFKDYSKMYVTGVGENLPFIYERVGERWEVAVSVADGKFQQISFVNSINTMNGGQHVNYITTQLISKLQTLIKKKHKGLSVKPYHIKNHLWVFINCLVENPAFDSQTKFTLTTRKNKFGSTCNISDKFVQSLMKTDFMDHVLKFARFKQSKELKKSDGRRAGRITGIPKLCDANNAGGKKSSDCTLILTEGDSAKAVALSGLSVVGRDNYGVFPLKGKLLNVRDAKHKQIAENKEVMNLKKIIGLQQGKSYTDTKSLRYGSVMIMADQDHDGSHIKGLVINLFSHFWPSLYKMPGFIVEFITPIVKCTKGKKSERFFTLPEYEEWKERNNNGKGWKIKYYKGLGTNTQKEAKEYFSDLNEHVINFKYEDDEDDDAIEMVFSKKGADRRKQWLSEFKVGTYLAQTDIDHLRYKDFVNKELILFSMESNCRAIPSLVDGLKPGQRKIMYSCFKRNLTKEIKVAQLAGYVSEHSAYHHGEASLTSTIVKMAQNYVGSNNINLLMPNGQFGTRYEGGSDAASPRYIFTKLSAVTRTIFCPNDDNILDYLFEDGQKVEPMYYVPILPMVLVNGAAGMGTGWSTNIPNYDPREICENIRRMMNGKEPEEMSPWYKGFVGDISKKKTNTYNVSGVVEKITDTKLKITELPVGCWTQKYRILLEDWISKGYVKNFRENHTDNTVSFTVDMTEEKITSVERTGLKKFMKLNSSLSTSNIVLFDSNGQLHRYNSPEDILKEFYDVRMDFYEKRKEYLVETLSNEVKKLSNKARFIRAVIDGDVVIQRKKKAEIIDQLQEQGYALFPKNKKSDDEDEENEEADEKSLSSGYDYLLGMQLWSLTLEKIQKLEAELEEKTQDLEELEATTHKQLWSRDIDEFLQALDEHEERELAERKGLSKLKKKGRKKSKYADDSDSDYMPTKKPGRSYKPKPKQKATKAQKTGRFKVVGKKAKQPMDDSPNGSEKLMSKLSQLSLEDGSEDEVQEKKTKRATQKAPAKKAALKKAPAKKAQKKKGPTKKPTRKTAKKSKYFEMSDDSSEPEEEESDFVPTSKPKSEQGTKAKAKKNDSKAFKKVSKVTEVW
ncbi:hypothetical protein AAMO2058_000101500 [Amorphochlora amoebiformis]